MSNERTNADVVRDLAASLGEVREVGDQQFVIVPHGYDVKNFDTLRDKPRRLKEDVSFSTLDGYLKYVERFGDEGSTVTFAVRRTMSFVTKLDYHTPGEASWCCHQASYKAPASREAEEWKKIDGERLSQRAMIEFLEDHCDDIGEDLAKLVGPMSKVTVKRKGDSTHVSGNMAQGRTTDESVEVEGEFPDTVQVNIPLLFRGEKYALKARLRAFPCPQASGSKIDFMLKFTNLDAAYDDAYKAIVAKIPFHVYE